MRHPGTHSGTARRRRRWPAGRLATLTASYPTLTASYLTLTASYLTLTASYLTLMASYPGGTGRLRLIWRT